MVEIQQSKVEEINDIVAMERDIGTSRFINPYSKEQHLYEMKQDQIIYLSIYWRQKLVGFIILAHEEQNCVEFRRIVVAVKGQGIGQLALNAMESYCKHKFGCKRIWLDVFEDNTRGVYLYKKMGFKQFRSQKLKQRNLLFMDKKL